MTREEAKLKLKELLFTKSGTFNPHFERMYDKWLEHPEYSYIKREFLDKYITDKPLNSGKYDKMRIFCFLNGESEDKYKVYPVCPICGKNPLTFRSIAEGFSATCNNKLCIGEIGKKNKNKHLSNLNFNRREFVSAISTVKTQEVRSIIKQIVDSKGRVHNSKFNKFISDESNRKSLESLMRRYKIDWLTLDAAHINEILYCIDNQITERPMCTVCGKYPVSFRSFVHGYSPVCNNKACQKEFARISSYKREKPTYSEKNIITRNKKIQTEYNGNEQAYWDDIIQKRRNTLLERYGVDHPMKIPEVRTRVSKKVSETKLQQSLSRFNELWSNEFDVLDVQKGAIAKIQCKKCGNIFRTALSYVPICPVCEKNRMSRAEREVALELQKMGIQEIETNRILIKDSTGRHYEVDIYLPEYNFAIEYNGLFYHKTVSYEDSNSVPRDYHIKKSLYCRNAEIFLVHIWEDWWKTKRDCILSYISRILELDENFMKISKEEYSFEKLTTDASKKFFNTNHLYGYVDGKAFGLVKENEIVSAMIVSFNNGNLKIKRYCDKNFYNVEESFNYILDNVLKNFPQCKTVSSEMYIDLSNFPEYTVYYDSGFKILNTPRAEFDIYPIETYYVYISKTNQRIHWQHIFKHKIKKFIPEEFHEQLDSLTTYQIADLVGGRIHTGVWRFRKNL